MNWPHFRDCQQERKEYELLNTLLIFSYRSPSFFLDFFGEIFGDSPFSSPFLVTFPVMNFAIHYIHHRFWWLSCHLFCHFDISLSFPLFWPFFYGHPVGSLRWRWVPSKTIQVVIFFSKIILNHHLLLLRSFLTFGTSSSLLQWMMTPNMPSRRPESWNFPLLRESANYTKDCLYQDSRAKEDSCEKNFPTHRQLTPGLLLMTCSCQLKVVYGFEMMMTWESPCMLFEVIMNRFENDYSPDIIYDASCKLKEYAFNREPKRFMSIRVTSDGFHENNHKTCSSSFKTSSYPSLRNANSEACEQFNSVLRRISSSTTFMQQSVFMRAITLFIANQNIIANQKK